MLYQANISLTFLYLFLNTRLEMLYQGDFIGFGNTNYKDTNFDLLRYLNSGIERKIIHEKLINYLNNRL